MKQSLANPPTTLVFFSFLSSVSWFTHSHFFLGALGGCISGVAVFMSVGNVAEAEATWLRKDVASKRSNVVFASTAARDSYLTSEGAIASASNETYQNARSQHSRP